MEANPTVTAHGGGTRRLFGAPVLALGFRPFFLLAGAAGVFLVLVWTMTWAPGRSVGPYYGFMGWHAHEMVFGYAVAVVAGFLLTAIRNWTGQPTASGGVLASLAGLWLAGRVLPLAPVPGWIVALVDLPFLPLLAVTLAVPLVRAGQARNAPFVVVLGALAVANVFIHLDRLHFAVGASRPATWAAVDLVVLLILLVGGRVVPFFTERALPGAVPVRSQAVEVTAIGSAVLFVVTRLVAPASSVLAAVALVAGAANLVRLTGWYDHRVRKVPLLWVLYAGYGWIVAGFFLQVFAATGEISPFLPLHAFTAGGIGVMTLGMMARVSLGHTGRPLVASRPVALAFVLANAAAFVRVFPPILWPDAYAEWVALSGALWVTAFLLFLTVYAPVLLRPRVDGKAG